MLGGVGVVFGLIDVIALVVNMGIGTLIGPIIHERVIVSAPLPCNTEQLNATPSSAAVTVKFNDVVFVPSTLDDVQG